MSTKIPNAFEIKIQTTKRNELVEVTTAIRETIRRKRLNNGIILIYSPHTTAGVCIQENADPAVCSDLLAKLEALVPKSENYYQHREGNSDSHLKAVLTGNSATVFFENGKLVLGEWQGVYLCEFDGPRERKLWLKVLHEQVHSSDLD